MLASLVYAVVGRRVARRKVEGEAGMAWVLFSVWWYALAGLTLIQGLLALAGAVGVTDLSVHLALTHAVLLVLCVALFALAYYLLYLFTGKRSLLWPLAAAYGGYYLFLEYIVAAAQPIGVQVRTWTVNLQYTHDLAGTPVSRVLGLLLFVPIIIGAIAYFSLYFKVQDPTQKYRIKVIAWSIILWFGSSLVASNVGLNDFYWWPLISRGIGVAAALGVYAAFSPPQWVQRRWGVQPLQEEAVTRAS